MPLFSKKTVLTPFGGPQGFLLQFTRFFLPYSVAGILFGGSSRTRKGKYSLGCRENPKFEKLADSWHIWTYSQVQWPYSVMQSGASPGSSVGNTND